MSDWDDWVEEGPPCPGLFDAAQVFQSAEKCWKDAQSRGFDIVKLRKEWRM
jgi:hypothetical protein